MKKKKKNTQIIQNSKKIVSFIISYDSITDLFNINENEKKIIDLLYKITMKNSSKAIDRIIIEIKNYPNLPQLYNYLTVCYFSMGDDENAIKTIQYTMKKFPDYLFSKISWAEHLLSKKLYNQIPKLFNNKFDLKLLYPERNIFHYSEVLSFYAIMTQYFFYIGELDKSVIFLNAMIKIDSKDYRTKYIKKFMKIKTAHNTA